MPQDLSYLGAFRLPLHPEDQGWEYGGGALTYLPAGDPTGPDDDYPGSLYGTGHDWYTHVSEIGIPALVISPTKNLDELNTAATLQEFQDIRGDLFRHLDFEIPRACLEYLSPQGEQSSGMLHLCWGQHYQDERGTSHGWANLDLSNPQTAGA
jgi:hypothetical protein